MAGDYSKRPTPKRILKKTKAGRLIRKMILERRGPAKKRGRYLRRLRPVRS